MAEEGVILTPAAVAELNKMVLERRRTRQPVTVQPRRRYETTASSSATPFIVQSIQNNWLTCRTWDGSTAGSTDILVAKPFLLRHVLANYPQLTSFTTVNAQQATVVESGNTYTWKVTLPYAADEIIWAQPTTLGDLTSGGNPLVWEDTNRGAHAWGVEE